MPTDRPTLSSQWKYGLLDLQKVLRDHSPQPECHGTISEFDVGCGGRWTQFEVSRIGTWGQDIWLATQYISDWHGQVGHEGAGAVKAQEHTVDYNQKTFEYVMVELASRMNEVVMEMAKLSWITP